MDYDENSFLTGISVGMSMKGVNVTSRGTPALSGVLIWDIRSGVVNTDEYVIDVPQIEGGGE